MFPFRCVVLSVLALSCTVRAQTQKAFPTDQEIKLVLDQTERALQQYNPVLNVQEVEMGKSDDIARSRDVVNALETAVRVFRGNPQAFNGPLGFSLFEWLDDAALNASRCAGGATLEATAQMGAGDIGKANSYLTVAQGCAGVSTLIYTVSENAGALYERYLAGMSQLVDQAVLAAKQYADLIKKNSK